MIDMDDLAAAGDMERKRKREDAMFPRRQIQRYTFEKVGESYQFTTTTDGLWVRASDVLELERELSNARGAELRWEQMYIEAEERLRALPEAATIAELRLALAKAADTFRDAEKVFSMYGRDSAAAAMKIAADHCRDVLCGREQCLPQERSS